MYIDQDSPIEVHPELTVEWNRTATYGKLNQHFSNPFERAMAEFMDDIRHDIRLLMRTMIIVASELRHVRYEGVPVEFESVRDLPQD